VSHWAEAEEQVIRSKIDGRGIEDWLSRGDGAGMGSKTGGCLRAEEVEQASDRRLAAADLCRAVNDGSSQARIGVEGAGPAEVDGGAGGGTDGGSPTWTGRRYVGEGRRRRHSGRLAAALGLTGGGFGRSSMSCSGLGFGWVKGC
jgi:hypothetical protein